MDRLPLRDAPRFQLPIQFLTTALATFVMLLVVDASTYAGLAVASGVAGAVGVLVSAFIFRERHET